MGSLAQAWKDEGIEIGEARGKKKGIQIGEARGEAKMVKMMLDNGSSIESISKMTGLSIARINELLKVK